MLPLPTRCPLTGGEIIVTRIYCPGCRREHRRPLRRRRTAALTASTPEQIQFVEIFVRNEGKLNRMKRISASYPTIRSRLHDVIRPGLRTRQGRSRPGGRPQTGAGRVGSGLLSL